jgi:hypothetical protein
MVVLWHLARPIPNSCCGVPFYIHWALPLFIALLPLIASTKRARMGHSRSNYVYGPALWITVTLHELGHALVGKALKFKVSKISLAFWRPDLLDNF